MFNLKKFFVKKKMNRFLTSVDSETIRGFSSIFVKNNSDNIESITKVIISMHKCVTNNSDLIVDKFSPHVIAIDKVIGGVIDLIKVFKENNGEARKAIKTIMGESVDIMVEEGKLIDASNKRSSKSFLNIVDAVIKKFKEGVKEAEGVETVVNNVAGKIKETVQEFTGKNEPLKNENENDDSELKDLTSELNLILEKKLGDLTASPSEKVGCEDEFLTPIIQGVIGIEGGMGLISKLVDIVPCASRAGEESITDKRLTLLILRDVLKAKTYQLFIYAHLRARNNLTIVDIQADSIISAETVISGKRISDLWIQSEDDNVKKAIACLISMRELVEKNNKVQS